MHNTEIEKELVEESKSQGSDMKGYENEICNCMRSKHN